MKLRLTAAVLTTLAAFICPSAGASGDYSQPRFANAYATDVAFAKYQAGELGVLRPTYHRTYLYLAWRAIALGEKGIKGVPNRVGGLQRALGEPAGGWSDTQDHTKVFEAWQAQVDAALRQNPASASREYFRGYLNCPARSYRMATDSLAGLAKRSDATPARLRDWIATQRQVFKFCGDDAEQAVYDGKPKKLPPMPVALPAAEATHWRQMQQYQLAAAAFYAGQYSDAAQRFGKIGATPGHPLLSWGAYLGMRAQIRAAYADQQRKTDPLPVIAKTAAAILADASLAPRHDDTRALLRSAQAALAPEDRMTELSRLLDNPASDPFADDYLGDWRVLADLLFDSKEADDQQLTAALRKSTSFVDWIETLGACPLGADPAKNAAACAGARSHAEQAWRQAVLQKDAVRARLWLTAAALMADSMSAELEQGAARVEPGAPEYLSLRYALARHYRLAAQLDKARATNEAALASNALRSSASVSARNLFLRERFSLASSVDDAAPYLAQRLALRQDADTGETSPGETASDESVRPAGDGMVWLNASLATSELASLGNNDKVPALLRARIAVAAWMRAGLLGEHGAALQSAASIEKNVPALAGIMRQYRALPEEARLNFMLVSALRFNLSPTVGSGGFGPYVERSKEDSLADLWCKVTADPDGLGLPEGAKALAVPAANPAILAARSTDIKALGALKTASGYLGEHVLARADTTPADPELPWMLHVVVKSTRGGCLDADAKTLSRTAFALLHKRFKKSPWAAKTPYHY